MSRNLWVWAGLALVSTNVWAQTTTNEETDNTITLDEVVVTGTRFAVPIEKSGNTIYKISGEQLAKNAGKTVADILNEVPGIQMDGNFGSPGTNLNIFSRGARSNKTLILIDGVPLNDPSGINASYDLRLLPVSQIESIEVLKNGLSTLYGSGAAAAVINITLKKAGSTAFGGNVDASYGSFNTYQANAAVNGKIGGFSYRLAGNYQKSDGFSAALDRAGSGNFDKDGLENQNGLLTLGYALNDNFDVQALVAYDAFETEYDNGAFADGDNQQTGDMFRVGLTPRLQYNKGEVTVKALYAINNREFVSAFPTAYQGTNLQLDASNKHYISNTLTSFVGVNFQSFSYEQRDVIDFGDTQFSLIDPYASLFFDHSSGLTVHGGVRLNYHSVYGPKLVYNLNPSFLLGLGNEVKVKVLGALTSSYITPSGFQLFSNFGNLDLQPQEALNIEFGAALYLGDMLTLNLGYFSRNETSAIGFANLFDDMGNWIGGKYFNDSTERQFQGFEADFVFQPLKQLSVAGNYSHVTNEKLSLLYRIPQDKFGATINYTPWSNTALSVKYNFTGARTVYDFGTFSEVALKAFGVLDLYVQQKLLNQRLTVYGALNNVTDEDYVAILGFTTRGRNFNVGLNYNF